ncbi:hypothetical protein D3C87_1384470 [compost metagenome]
MNKTAPRRSVASAKDLDIAASMSPRWPFLAPCQAPTDVGTRSSPSSLASAVAKSVFPVPGGPTKRIPLSTSVHGIISRRQSLTSCLMASTQGRVGLYPGNSERLGVRTEGETGFVSVEMSKPSSELRVVRPITISAGWFAIASASGLVTSLTPRTLRAAMTCLAVGGEMLTITSAANCRERLTSSNEDARYST